MFILRIIFKILDDIILLASLTSNEALNQVLDCPLSLHLGNGLGIGEISGHELGHEVVTTHRVQNLGLFGMLG